MTKDGADRGDREVLAALSEEQIKSWLVEHYGHSSRMRKDRMDRLLEVRGDYPYLNPDMVPLLYRGLFNVTSKTLERLREQDDSDEAKDKSWTTSKSIAWSFARGENSDEQPIPGRFAVVLSASMPTERSLLNYKKAAREPGIGDQQDPDGDDLSTVIKSEREVLVSGSASISKVESEELEPRTNGMSNSLATLPTQIFAYDDDWYSEYDGVSPRLEDDGKTLCIPVVDVVAKSSWWGSVFSAKTVRKALNKHPDAEKIVLEINCPGGEVFEGTEIYNVLRRDGRPVEAHVLGIAASMASVIMLAADERYMAPGSMVMIHDPWSIAIGGPSDMEEAGERLAKIRDNMLDIYVERTGGSEAAIKAAMKAETWLTQKESVDWGFGTAKMPEPVAHATPKALAGDSTWNARRGMILSKYRHSPVSASQDQHLGWSGFSEDELRAVAERAAAASTPSLAEALRMSAEPAPTPERPAAASVKAGDLGTFSIDINVNQITTKPSEAPPQPRAEMSSGTDDEDDNAMDEFRKQMALSLGLSEDATPEQIAAEATKQKAEATAANAAATEARAKAEAEEGARLQAEADAASKAAIAAAKAEAEREIYARQAYDAKVKAMVSDLPPALSESMRGLCYSEHGGETKASEKGFEAAERAIAALPDSVKKSNLSTMPTTPTQAQAIASAPAGDMLKFEAVASMFSHVPNGAALAAHREKLSAKQSKQSASNHFLAS